MKKKPAVKKTLEERVKEELTPIDIEKAFSESLDSEGVVDVAGMEFYPSRIWEELDPIAFSCGASDYADNMACDGEWAEVEGEYYDAYKVAEIQDEIDNEEGA